MKIFQEQQNSSLKSAGEKTDQLSVMIRVRFYNICCCQSQLLKSLTKLFFTQIYIFLMELIKWFLKEKKEQEEHTENEGYFYNDVLVQVPKQEKDKVDPIGLLITKAEMTHIFGTAWLVCSNVIVTVAHNIHPLDKKQLFANKLTIEFYPDANCQLGTGIKIKEFFIPPDYYEKTQKIVNDIAFCLLEKPISRKKYMGVGYNFECFGKDNKIDDNLHKVKSLFLYGYPARFYQLNSQNKKIPLMGLQIPREKFSQYILDANIKIGYMNHKISTDHGHSGAPIFASTQHGLVAIGMHTSFKTNKNKDAISNGAILFNKSFIGRLQEFIQKHNKPNMITTLNMSVFRWDETTISQPGSFLANKGRILRTDKKLKERCQIKSFDLASLFLSSNILKVRFHDFNYENVEEFIEFGVHIKSAEKEQMISYTTYRKMQGFLGYFKKGKQKKEELKDLFIEKGENVELIIDRNKKQSHISFVKIDVHKNKKTLITFQQKWYCQAVSVFLFAKMMFPNCFLQVEPIIKDE